MKLGEIPLSGLGRLIQDVMTDDGHAINTM